jgi:hypothetical protein
VIRGRKEAGLKKMAEPPKAVPLVSSAFLLGGNPAQFAVTVIQDETGEKITVKIKGVKNVYVGEKRRDSNGPEKFFKVF